jgi:hypothetical protein
MVMFRAGGAELERLRCALRLGCFGWSVLLDKFRLLGLVSSVMVWSDATLDWALALADPCVKGIRLSEVAVSL